MIEPVFKIKVDEETNIYGRFVLEPFEQGYGQTLGNSLRRVLLSSLPGAAITAVSIDGVKHQFSVVPGLKEDVVELILNIKRIRLIIHGDQDVELSLHKVGPGVVTAGDIEVPAGVTIVNPDLVLGTLADEKSSLSMTLKARKGYGYAPVEQKQEHAIGIIPVDALYSPVVRVNYRVEATRVGRMTNLDKLIMEIWTDGTIQPFHAMQSAAKILITYFSQIVEPKDVKLEELAQPSSSPTDDFSKMKIEEFDIPTRIVNALAKGGIETVGDLLKKPKEDLLNVKNLGAKSLQIVGEKLKEKGIPFTV